MCPNNYCLADKFMKIHVASLLKVKLMKIILGFK